MTEKTESILSELRALRLDVARGAHALARRSSLRERVQAVISSSPEVSRPESERDARTFYCTFCRRSQHEVAQLIAGPSPAFICDECTLLCAKIVAKKRALRRRERTHELTCCGPQGGPHVAAVAVGEDPALGRYGPSAQPLPTNAAPGSRLRMNSDEDLLVYRSHRRLVAVVDGPLEQVLEGVDLGVARVLGEQGLLHVPGIRGLPQVLRLSGAQQVKAALKQGLRDDRRRRGRLCCQSCSASLPGLGTVNLEAERARGKQSTSPPWPRGWRRVGARSR